MLREFLAYPIDLSLATRLLSIVRIFRRHTDRLLDEEYHPQEAMLLRLMLRSMVQMNGSVIIDGETVSADDLRAMEMVVQRFQDAMSEIRYGWSYWDRSLWPLCESLSFLCEGEPFSEDVLAAELPPAPVIALGARWFLTEDRRRLVPEGDPEARVLYRGEGETVLVSALRAYRLPHDLSARCDKAEREHDAACAQVRATLERFKGCGSEAQ